MSATKIAIIVDAACDLPAQFIAENNILVLPFHINTEKGDILDNRNEEAFPDLYAEHLHSKSGTYAQSSPVTKEELKAFFINNLITQYDQAILLTIASSRSDLYRLINSAWYDISTSCMEIRKNHGLASRFYLRTVDTANIGPGQALLAYLALGMLAEGLSASSVVQKLNELKLNIYTYGIPNDLLYLYTRAKLKKENSISWGKYMLGNVLNLRPIIRFNNGKSSADNRTNSIENGLRKIVDHLTKQVEQGLSAPVICISYSGSLFELTVLPDYRRLELLARTAKIELLLCAMSLTVAVNFGANALAISFASAQSEL